MKKISALLLGIYSVLLIACSGSDTYRGSWKATDFKGAKFEISFDAKSFTVKDSTGKNIKFDYTQNSVKIANSIKTYGIKLGDGRGYQINFPKNNDESLALIIDQNGSPIYTISRKAYLKYEDIYKLE
ncbi:hypothetical protein [Pedobacter punctiformis]|uniref:Lipoprotein n=1 Tax=Pedobacter punctiformis TaxID=3004097 RepID=A0ABT4LBX1_9SPHI|nr:hypothetical protein [Pedobacter sp. HCMS5-2]MCZ4245404.1 hypothetical protein [Pedobacter sp. HCMS5-2]